MEAENTSEYDNFSKFVYSMPCSKKTKVYRTTIIEYEEFLRFMKEISYDARYRFIDTLSSVQVNVLSQVFKHLLNRNLFKDRKDFNFVRKFRKEIIQMSHKNTAVYKKKAILQSTIGDKLLDKALYVALSTLLILKNT